MGSLGGSNPSGKSYKGARTKVLPQSTTQKMKSAYRGKGKSR